MTRSTVVGERNVHQSLQLIVDSSFRVPVPSYPGLKNEKITETPHVPS
jgi:hypothetical protein